MERREHLLFPERFSMEIGKSIFCTKVGSVTAEKHNTSQELGAVSAELWQPLAQGPEQPPGWWKCLLSVSVRRKAQKKGAFNLNKAASLVSLQGE